LGNLWRILPGFLTTEGRDIEVAQVVPIASSPRPLVKYVRNTRSPSRMNALWPCHWSSRIHIEAVGDGVQGISQPIAPSGADVACCAREALGESGVAGVQMGHVRDLIGAQGAAAAGVLGPAEHSGFEEGDKTIN